MHKLNNENRIDRFKESDENALEMRAKKLREMAATTGVSVIYGLLFTNLVFAPLLPHLAAQSNSPTNSAGRPIYNNPEFYNAASREDCDRILKEVLKRIKDQDDEIDAAWEAAKYCDTRYGEELQMNELRLLGAMEQAKLKTDEIFLECMGLGGILGTSAARASSRWTIRIRGSTVAIGRVGSGAIGLIVGFATYKTCKELMESTAQSMIDAANKEKELADEMSLTKRDNCRETTNYARVKRRYDNWQGGRYPSGKGYRYNPRGHRNAINRANADHEKCLAEFPSGDCGTTD